MSALPASSQAPGDTAALPASMEALVLLEPGRFEIREVPVPTPGPGEVLARVRAVSICGTDAHLIRGDYPGFWPPSFPFIPGHEWAGEIVTLGPGVERYGLAVGDRVAAAAEFLRGRLKGFGPSVGIVLGSGLGELAGQGEGHAALRRPSRRYAAPPVHYLGPRSMAVPFNTQSPLAARLTAGPR